MDFSRLRNCQEIPIPLFLGIFQNIPRKCAPKHEDFSINSFPNTFQNLHISTDFRHLAVLDLGHLVACTRNSATESEKYLGSQQGMRVDGVGWSGYHHLQASEKVGFIIPAVGSLDHRIRINTLCGQTITTSSHRLGIPGTTGGLAPPLNSASGIFVICLDTSSLFLQHVSIIYTKLGGCFGKSFVWNFVPLLPCGNLIPFDFAHIFPN